MQVFDGLKVYRNYARGIVVHRCQNINIANSLFADNSVSIDIDRAEGIEVTNTKIIGESESFRKLLARQDVEIPCRQNNPDGIVGINLHTWKKEKEWAGAKISNVDMSGFGNVTCAYSASINYDTHVRIRIAVCDMTTSDTAASTFPHTLYGTFLYRR
jgi:hypothetical protein